MHSILVMIFSNLHPRPKLTTVEKSLIIRILGEVDDDLKAEINSKLAACYRL
jgi:hypothetical protein